MNSAYIRFNDSLGEKIVPAVAVPAAATPSEEPEKTQEATGAGTLIIQASLAGGAVPVEGVKITIYDENGNILSRSVTDNSGRTPAITLKAPSAEYSRIPENTVLPYSIYNATVEAEGYYIEKLLNIPIFDGINSIQPISLNPLREGAEQGTEDIINEGQ